jgi:hypothetical protein
MRRSGWLAFGLWALPGVVLALQISAFGLLLAPIGVGVTVLLVRSTRVWPEVLGIGEGAAAVCFLVVALNSDYWGCPPSGEVITRTPTSLTVESCGGVNPWPWLIVGAILATGAALAYGVARRPRGPSLNTSAHPAGKPLGT